MAWKLVHPVLAAAVILAGCGQVGTTTGGEPESTGGDGGAGAGTQAGTGGGGGAGQGGAGVGGDTGEGGSITPDGCSPTGRQCAAGEYCDYGEDTCGAAGSLGRCTPKPEGCPDEPRATCGCDGTIHYNGCYANQEGADAANTGGCTAPDGYFPCGAVFCQSRLEYCQRSLSDVAGSPDTYSCKELPAACSAGVVTCACLVGEQCSSDCARVGSSDDLIVTCPGG